MLLAAQSVATFILFPATYLLS